MVHAVLAFGKFLTDYVKCAKLRAVLGFVLNLMAVAYVAIGLIVLWGV